MYQNVSKLLKMLSVSVAITATQDMDQDVEQSMAAVDAENLMRLSQELFHGEPSHQFRYVETAMKTIVTKLNDVGHRLTYIAQLHSVDTSPSFLPALSYLNNYVLNQPSKDNWVDMQEKVITFLYEVFVTGLHEVVDENKTFRSLGRIDKLYTNLNLLGSNEDLKWRVRVRARLLTGNIELSLGALYVVHQWR